MPTRKTANKAREDAREGKSPSTQAGEFVREEIHHIREGKHGARNPKQAIAIGLSKARRAGVELPAPDERRTAPRTRRKANQDSARGRKASKAPSRRRSRASASAVRREGQAAASPRALSRQSKQAAARRKRRQPAASRRRRASTSTAAR